MALDREKRRHWRVSFAWYDLWVGAFYDRAKRVLYICPVPCLLIEWRRPSALDREPEGHGYAFRCEVCDGDPAWRLDRIGDAAVTWACELHLARAMTGMQRRRAAPTEVVVTRSTAALIREIEETLADGS